MQMRRKTLAIILATVGFATTLNMSAMAANTDPIRVGFLTIKIWCSRRRWHSNGRGYQVIPERKK
jgi:hypothetical protein